jgi:hypothetical protein
LKKERSDTDTARLINTMDNNYYIYIYIYMKNTYQKFTKRRYTKRKGKVTKRRKRRNNKGSKKRRHTNRRHKGGGSEKLLAGKNIIPLREMELTKDWSPEDWKTQIVFDIKKFGANPKDLKDYYENFLPDNYKKNMLQAFNQVIP